MSVFNHTVEGFLSSSLFEGVLTIVDALNKKHYVNINVKENFDMTNIRKDFTDVFCALKNDKTIFSARKDGTYSLVNRSDNVVKTVGVFDYDSLPFRDINFEFIAYGRLADLTPTILSRETSGLYKDIAFEYVEGTRGYNRLYKIKKELPKADATLSLVYDKLAAKNYTEQIFLPKGDWRDYFEQI